VVIYSGNTLVYNAHVPYHVLNPVVPMEIVVCSSMTVTILLHSRSKLYDLKQGSSGGPPSSGLSDESRSQLHGTSDPFKV
jgi:hypothetical protein